MLRIFLTVSTLGLAASAAAQPFTYNPPGHLVSGSGTGRVDHTVQVPGMRFPIEESPAYLNSQVYAPGGSHGGPGGQCAAVNYAYPWWDNYCESRSWTMPLCPAGVGHQGQDMRAATCQDNVHWTVATENGTITHIGTYSVYHQGDSGVRHRYLHLKPSSLVVSVGQRVSRGERIGRVSDAFGNAGTTVHLHYDMRKYVSGHGNVYVSPYMSLVSAYEDLIGPPGPFEDVPADHQFAAAIAWLSAEGITHGCNAAGTLFCPDNIVTREQMASFIARALSLPATSTDYFTDDDSSSHEDNINKLAAAGITYGCGSGLFCPDRSVTRAETASFLARALGLPSSSVDHFTDDDGLSHEGNINRIADAQITRGCNSAGTLFCPQDDVIRAHMAAFLYRALGP